MISTAWEMREDERGIFLCFGHLGAVRVKVANDIHDFKDFLSYLNVVYWEIKNDHKERPVPRLETLR